MTSSGIRTHSDVQTKIHKLVWDPKAVEIRTRSVEKTLEPLVRQVTTLVNQSKKRRNKGRSKKATEIAKDIEFATKRLVEVGESIARDFIEIEQPMLEACKDAQTAGEAMKTTSWDFALDPCDSNKRNVMIRSARALLSSVTRLLCIADMADVYRLLATLMSVEERLKDLGRVQTNDELIHAFKHYGDDLMKVAKLTGMRQVDLKDSRRKEEMAAARSTLKTSSRMLHTTTKAYINHPGSESALQNRDFVINEVSNAVATIANVAQAVGKANRHPYEEVGYLANALDELMTELDREPEEFLDEEVQADLSTLVNDIVTGASSLAETICVREISKEKILEECRNVKNALTHLIEEALPQIVENPDEVDDILDEMEHNTKILSKQLRKTVVDHASDSFLQTDVPLAKLIKAAEIGNKSEVEHTAQSFMEYATKLEEVSTLTCSLSTNAEGIKLTKIGAKNLSTLSPQVVNAARTLAIHPKSVSAQENMHVFANNWRHQARILTEAVDDITTIDDFLIVSEGRILEDINRCVESLEEQHAERLDTTASSVRVRMKRVEHVVLTEMQSYESSSFTQTVLKSVQIMKDNIMPQFLEHIDYLVDALTQTPIGYIDMNAFIDAARLVHEGMRDIRKAVSLRNPPEFSDTDSDDDVDEQEMLLKQMSDAQAKQREKRAYEQIKAGGKVQFEVHSEGVDDPGSRGVSSIVVNGVEYCPRKSGHNVVVLDEIGTVVSSQGFDTTSQKEGVAMARYLDEIPDDHVALIAVQGSSGDGVEAASSALKKFGAVEPINPGYGASWAFAGYKGNHQNKSWVSQIYRPRYEGPAMISDMINTPAADMGKISVQLHAEGCEDEPYMRIASIKVNDIERSPMGRGLNVVVLDSAGNYMLSKNFDTSDPYHSINEGKRMKTFLDGLPNERIVCMTSLESPAQQRLGYCDHRKGDGLDEAKDALLRIGANDPIEPGMNGSFAFIGYTGPQRVTWAKQVSRSRKDGPARITEFLFTPAALAEAEADVETKEVPLSEHDLVSITIEDYEEKQESEDEEEEEIISQKSARSLMRALPAEEKAKINKLAEGLTVEKDRLFTEANKWDEQGNDIIVLAKRMCLIMMDMSDFTRGEGPLKNTMDVVKAAEKIAKYGSQMNKLAGEIAEICPHSHTRSDLLAYLQRVALYSHQLTITARVKADVQMISGEPIITGIDGATSLIEAAKNLMNAVIATLKSSYIASTKHRTDGLQVVQWRMRAPEKKPLYKVPVNYSDKVSYQDEISTPSINVEQIGDFRM